MKLQKDRVYVLLSWCEKEPYLVKLISEATLYFSGDTIAMCKDRHGNSLVVDISNLKPASERQRVAFNRKYYERG